MEHVQKGNEEWWTRNTMSYDWDEQLGLQRGTLEWFAEIDRRFEEGARLFSTGDRAFDRFIPYRDLDGARVLEIGCGMAMHSELMVRAGADLSAVDISQTSVDMTRRRLELKRLKGNILRVDAETLPFESGSFDFVWSWGVIHHSSRTGRIVREIARVLAPTGRTCVMVYNRQALSVMLGVVRDQLLRGGLGQKEFRGVTLREHRRIHRTSLRQRAVRGSIPNLLPRRLLRGVWSGRRRPAATADDPSGVAGSAPIVLRFEGAGEARLLHRAQGEWPRVTAGRLRPCEGRRRGWSAVALPARASSRVARSP